MMCASRLSELTFMKHIIERPRSSIIFVLLTAVLFISGCRSKDQVQAAGSSGGRPPAPVVVARVEQRDIPVQIKAIGNVEAYQTVQIRSQVNGQIQKIFFKEGEDVREANRCFNWTRGLSRQTLKKPLVK